MPPSGPSFYGFCYTVPGVTSRGGRSFAIAGAGELPEGSLRPEDLVHHGDTTPGALQEKARFVMRLMSGRLKELTLTWDQATVAEMYTVHAMVVFSGEVVRPMGAGGLLGETWHNARPPIASMEYEINVPGCARELVLA